MSGVPVGVQVAVPVMITTGCPPAVTRVAPTVHCAVTHGPLPLGGVNAQPAIEYGALVVVIGWPPTDTRAFGAVGVA